MSYAPALTWMHLFPSGLSYGCDGGPAWFRDALRPTAADGGMPNVHVAFEQPMAKVIAAAGRADGLVAVNCRDVDVDALARAGFSYVRHFAAIPNIASARWFIPLDAPRVSAAAFHLYSPTRFSARLKRSLAQLMARLGIGLWYRDDVWVVQRELPPLERLLQQAMDGQSVRLALSAGAPEPARNRKASAALLRSDGSIAGFAKLASSPLATTLLAREAMALQALANIPAVAAPRLLASGEVDGRYVLVQSPLAGSPAKPALSAAHRRYLRALEAGPEKWANETQFVQSLGKRIATLARGGQMFAAIYEQTCAAARGLRVKATVVHGDFAPWNLRCREGEIAAFDWEYAQTDGLPLVDEVHHLLQVGYNIRKWDVPRAIGSLDEQAAEHAARYSRTHAVALQAFYLLDVLARLAVEGYGDADRAVAWQADLLRARAMSLPKAVPA